MKNEVIINQGITDQIFTIRGVQVILDTDLAELYQVDTKVLNQAVKRNLNRFPLSFRFQLVDVEKNELVTNCDRLDKLKHSTSNPYAFTEQGVAMLSAVLRSDVAVNVSIQIMNAFIEIRRFIFQNGELFSRLTRVELKQIDTDNKMQEIFSAIERREILPQQRIFFDGQVFEAYQFVSNLIRSAKKSIVLIDNYIDDTVLTLFSKRKKGVMLTILTKTVSKQLELDIKKYNEQFPPAETKEFKISHDRFLILDNTAVYHFGASLKDLGKKWFAFSKMDMGTMEIIAKIKINE